MNVYGFVENNVLNKWDKLGLCDGSPISSKVIKEWYAASISYDIDDGGVGAGLLYGIKITWKKEVLFCCACVDDTETTRLGIKEYVSDSGRFQFPIPLVKPVDVGPSGIGPLSSAKIIDLLGEVVAQVVKTRVSEMSGFYYLKTDKALMYALHRKPRNLEKKGKWVSPVKDNHPCTDS
jgi:hypothetical protein